MTANTSGPSAPSAPPSPSGPPRKRLDQMVAPGWARTASNLLRGVGIVVGLLLLWLGFVTGGFFMVLCGVLALIAIAGGWLLGGLVVRENWYGRNNAQPLSYALVVLFPLTLVLVAQLAGPLLTPAPNLTACFSGTPARDGELHTDLAVDPRVQSMTFTMQIDSISGGALRWFVQDPTGQSRWSGREEAVGTFSSDFIPASGGTWRINVISEADSADYKLEWLGMAGDTATTTSPSACLGGNL